MKTVVCAYCRHEVPDSSYCAVCGAPLIKTQRDLEGRQIQSYLIDELVGEGASGRLYKARHIATAQTVALKLLQPELATNPKSIRRFMREAEVGIRLQHPHAVKLFEFGIDKESGIFMVMELIQGVSLQKRLREEEQLTPQRALSIALQICDVLEKAHSLHIIHRDLKPANVLLEWNQDSIDYVKVCDFGLAKMELPSTDETRLTVPGTIYGTPGYMAPEQCLGEEADARTDIYALGVTLYELLSGKLPFAGSTPLELIMRPLQGDPLPLRRAYGELNEYPAIDLLEETVMRCLLRAPEGRYPNAQTLKLDLQMCLPSTLPIELMLTPSKMKHSPPPPTAFPWEPIKLDQERLDYCRNLMKDASTQTYLASQALFQKDQMPTRFYLIKSGQVRLLQHGDQHISEIDRLGPGDFVGVSSFFSRSPYTITAEAAHFSEIHVIDRTNFNQWVQEDQRLQALFHHFFHEFLQQDVMRYSPFFGGIPPSERANCIRQFELQPIGRGQEVLQAGQSGDHLYIIASGQMEVFWPTKDPLNPFQTRTLEAGEFFGEISVFTKRPVSASVRSVSNSILLRLEREPLMELVRKYPATLALLERIADERIKENSISDIDAHGDTIPV